MNNQIIIHEAVTQEDTEHFWDELHRYHKRDIFPDPGDEDLAYFLDDTQYRAGIETLHRREHDRCHYLFFNRNGEDIGFAMPVIYDTEDGKCFLCEFCVFPSFRGNGTGTECAQTLFGWAEENGAAYIELNFGGSERRRRFWQRQGFVLNGADEWGDPLMILPPAVKLPFTVERLTNPEDWQLFKLMNGFLSEIGEEMLTDEKKERLSKAIEEEKIVFFLAKRGYRAVGICSVSLLFSTFSCGMIGSFEDFYVEPAFRRKGIARMLTKAAQDWCREKDAASLTVCCADCDRQMYMHLGFEMQLGSLLAWTD